MRQRNECDKKIKASQKKTGGKVIIMNMIFFFYIATIIYHLLHPSQMKNLIGLGESNYSM